MNIRFDQQTILITGATRGIGRQLAIDFESLGGNVIITGTGVDSPDFVKTGNFEYYNVDFCNDEQKQGFIEFLGSKDKIDVCINNAGINRLNYLEDVEEIDFSDMMRVNLETPFLITKHVAKKMKTAGYGRIINISSIFGKLSKEKRSVYSVTKFGIKGLTVSSAIELAKFGVLVNTLSPGFVMTDLTKKNLSPEERNNLSDLVPAKRMAEPKEISNVALFLASGFNTYIAGQNIIVDGGYTVV
ncbi:SDR family oxidoreductase [Leptospira levettii]|uniref:SDR family NAD(P)-dependent oxidoreductase n=1 Tax=Leptospira levettii TaxID=2023178 RepID=UPI001082BDC0|nr:SDR family oxidoreductase [Leptospira levettii]TGM94159.1 SDR family oxidoreductase [Leptospira levettii]